MNKINLFSKFAVFLLILFLSGCSGTVKNMRTISSEEVATTPTEGKAMVIFMRPSGFGYAIQSSVFEVKNDTSTLVGIVAAKKKVSYELEPGQHIFMGISESAEFMLAELEENKTYYVLITPKMGVWKQRVSLEPIHANEIDPSELNDWLEDCEWVAKSHASEVWVNANKVSIQSKLTKYYPKWINKDLSEKLRLLPQDGK